MFNQKIEFGKFYLGKESMPFIVAEMSGNHGGSLERALSIVDAAAAAGVDALKIQTYTADTMTLNIREREFFIDDSKSLWHGKSLYELYREASTPWGWHPAIFERCKKRGILCFSTPFDSTAVDFLESLETPFYKIASFENTDIPLIKRVAATGKPLMISTGMATSEELGEAVQAVKETGNKNLILLKCTSAYPADPKDVNARTLLDLSERFQCLVGLSDHTLGLGVSLAAIALGAVVIEKHFTLSRSEGGVDAAFSMEFHEMKNLVEEARSAKLSLGEVKYGFSEKEKNSMRFRRSLYITRDVEKGQILNEKNVRSIRPGFGLSPKHAKDILGKKAKKDIRKGTPLTWDLVG